MSFTSCKIIYGWIPEWPKGTDCKSAANCFGGSNPPPSIRIQQYMRFRIDQYQYTIISCALTHMESEFDAMSFCVKLYHEHSSAHGEMAIRPFHATNKDIIRYIRRNTGRYGGIGRHKRLKIQSASFTIFLTTLDFTGFLKTYRIFPVDIPPDTPPKVLEESGKGWNCKQSAGMAE